MSKKDRNKAERREQREERRAEQEAKDEKMLSYDARRRAKDEKKEVERRAQVDRLDWGGRAAAAILDFATCRRVYRRLQHKAIGRTGGCP